MRRDFRPILHDFMKRDSRIWIVPPDLGYGFFDAIFADFPDRCFNVGASEQLAVGAAVGLAEEGKIPVVYSITPFLLWRPAEWHRNFLNHEEIPVKLLAAGRFEDGKECYDEDGHSHHAYDDRAFMAAMPKIKGYWPKNVADLPGVTEEWLYNGKPSYLNLKR